MTSTSDLESRITNQFDRIVDAVAADDAEQVLSYVFTDETGRQMFALTDPDGPNMYLATDYTMEIRP